MPHPQQAAALFHQTFQEEPTHFAFAPGRVNLIGEHTDYNQGYVFPAAIAQGVTIAAKPNPRPESSQVRLVSAQVDGVKSFALPAKPPVKGWARYPAAIAWALQTATPLDAALVSDLPMAAGVSSSAAVELAFATLWNHVDQLAHGHKTLALLAQKAENQFVGVNCGVMDQMASALGQTGQALFIDTLTLEVHPAPVPEGLAIVILDTGKPRSLSESAYNERRAQCEAAAAEIGVPSLRHATLTDLDKVKDSLTRARAKHVVTENQRCLDFRQALAENDLTTIGRLMAESHNSLRDDYQVSCPELDHMAACAQNNPACVGARMTGAGFGGACVALVWDESLQKFLTETEQCYVKAVQKFKPSLTTTTAAQGARILNAQSQNG